MIKMNKVLTRHEAVEDIKRLRKTKINLIKNGFNYNNCQALYGIDCKISYIKEKFPSIDNMDLV